MDVKLWSVKWQYKLLYVDDIVLFSRTPNKQIAPVNQILHLLQISGSTLKLN